MEGLFITVEGPDGAGKTSVINELIPRLKKIATKNIVTTREPGGSPIAEKIRGLVLDKKNTDMDQRTEALLYAASRRQHLVEIIEPALVSGTTVVCDRFVDSSLAYQGAGRKIGMKEVAQLNLFATNGRTPDLTLYLDVDAETGLSRIQNHRSMEVNRLDVESLEFHQRVRHGYIQLLEQYPQRIKKIDAKADLDHVVEDCLQVIQKYVGDKL
ncbi:dTMP kinase [Enterococcus timonensis]|uniref:dTMP kinase n=1 Tax=Enterococcus timonensis TaxID=1852364 RepID=UPI0008D92C9E|nr:dTMP kinase [Enterococcus timonensis]